MSQSPSEQFIHLLSQQQRVLVFGHMALRALGVRASRRSVELWLDPTLLESDWLLTVQEAAPEASKSTLQGQAAVLSQTGMVTLAVEGELVHVFRQHSDLENVSFDDSWLLATPVSEHCRLATALDLYMTRIHTEHPEDLADMNALEELVQAHFQKHLPLMPADAAVRMMDRFADPNSLSYAQHHKDALVRNHARSLLQSFADQGDPFSEDILQSWAG
jgi:hypothetical protein